MKKKIENSNGVTAIYVRRSVADRDNNSLSIESQKEDCIKYIGRIAFTAYTAITDSAEKIRNIDPLFSR